MKTKAPCINCNKRTPGCHDSCKEYKEWRDKTKVEKVVPEINLYYRDKNKKVK